MEPATDCTGIELTPGNPDTCKGNGQTLNSGGQLIECCCDECDFFMICAEAAQWEVKT